MEITVNVTEDHIRDGERESCTFCPVALAIKSVPGVTMASVGCNVISVWFSDDVLTICDAPPEVAKFTNDFDNGQRPQPFSFKLEA